MNDNVLRVLEYNEIITQLAAKAVSSLGKQLCCELQPLVDLDDIKQHLQRTRETTAILLTAAAIPLTSFHDVRAAARRAELGAVLDPHDLLHLSHTLYVARRMKSFIDALNSGEFLWLGDVACRIAPHKYLEDTILSAIDDNSLLKDSASSVLQKIRREIRVLRARIKEKLDTLVRSSETQKYLSDAVVTMRHDRYVIPVKQEYRSQVPGMVHDISGSGATLFIEPLSIVNINNDVRQLEVKEHQEVERILAQLSAEVGRFATTIVESCAALADVDCAFAKGRLALTMNATQPEITFNKEYRLKHARHPLIPNDKVVAVDINYCQPANLLLITGPNTGGKTVTLKTIGLFSLMAQSGLFIPADSGSKLPLYQNIFVDIGDEQSIEQNLSTFSGHMKNVTHILAHVRHCDLVLFDEIGAGTDPEEGAALAQAILERLINSGCMTVATTHYGTLKSFGYSNGHVKNASVEFDVRTLAPTYRLLIGIPGSSNALAISQRLGLDSAVIERARELTSKEHRAVENILGKIDADLRSAEEELHAARQQRVQVDKRSQEIASQTKDIINRRDTILEKARTESADIIRRARAEAEYVISELKKIQSAELDKRQDDINVLRKMLADAHNTVQQQEEIIEPPTIDGDIIVGSSVYIPSIRQSGLVENISGNSVLVKIGAIKSNMPLKKLRLLNNRCAVRAAQSGRNFVGSAVRAVTRSVDIRGKMVDEAIPEIDKFIDDAIMAGLSELFIVHGKGTGALRQGVREYLNDHYSVISFAYAENNEGGTGATKIKLR